MKTIFGRKSLPAIENRESFGVERVISGVVFLCNEGLSRDRRPLRRRSQPRRAVHHGISFDCRSSSRKAQALQRSRYLPDDCPSIELIDDRTGDGAVVPATSEASTV